MEKRTMKGIFLLGCCSLLFLSACQSKTKAPDTAKNKTASTTAKPTADKKEASEKEENQTKKEETSLWNDDKKQQLQNFMVSWGQSMGQTYRAYQPGDNVDYYGIKVPDQLLTNMQMIIDQKAVNHHWWQEKGKADSYQIVAVYSDIKTPPQQEAHLYVFTIKDEIPEVFIAKNSGENNQNALTFAPTQNQELKAGFIKIVGTTNTQKTTKKATQTPDIPGYSEEEVLAARFYLTITQQAQKAKGGVMLELFGYPKGRKVGTSETVSFPTVTYTLTSIPTGSGEWTFSEEENGTVKYYSLPTNYKDPNGCRHNQVIKKQNEF